MNMKTSKLEQQVQRLIDNNIFACQTHLIDALLKNAFTGNEAKIEYDEIINLYQDVDDEEEQKEVMEWWLITQWISEKLESVGAVVIRSSLGTWWGRTESGQSLTYDADIHEVANKLLAQ